MTAEQMLEGDLSRLDYELFAWKMDEEYRERLSRFCFSILGDMQGAQDAVQETFCKAVRNLSRFRKGSKLSTWLFSIARNCCVDQIRVAKPTLVLEEGSAIGTDEKRTIMRIVLHEALGNLPQTYREVLVLFDLERLSMQEVAEILHASIPAVKSRLYRGRKLLRELLSEAWADGYGILEPVPKLEEAS